MRKPARLAFEFATALAFGAVVVASSPLAVGASAASPSTLNTDRAIANDINLTAKDLPGWQASPDVTTKTNKASAARLAACLGTPRPATADEAKVNSPYFDSGNQEESSSVTFKRTRQDGAEALKAETGPKVVSCLRKVAIPVFRSALPKGTPVTRFQVTVLRPSWLPRSCFAYRLVLVFSTKDGTAAPVTTMLVADDFGFLVGRAEVDLSSDNVGAPPGIALEQRLLSTLVSRADKYASKT